MTREEFEAEIKNDLMVWISKGERPAHHWFLSVEDWARARYAHAYKEHMEEVKEDA